MSVTINGTNGLTFNDNTTQATSPFAGGLGFRNRIINGDMRIDQRNAGASVTPVDGGFGTDRWRFTVSQASKLTCQQSTVAPAGFSHSLLITSSSAYSVASGDYFGVYQRVEGFNTSDLAFGTASASTVTLSFWVRSSLTGTFGGALLNGAVNRSYPFTYTISAANTWEQKTVTIAGDTTGTWVGGTNGIGLMVNFGLGVGSTYTAAAGSWNGNSFCISANGAQSVVGTNGATFYITGVQLEKGSTATSFDYRPYGTELALCQRYFEKSDGSQGSGFFFSGNITNGVGYYTLKGFAVQKRATPTTAANNTSTNGFGTITVSDIDRGGFRIFSTANTTGSGGFYLGQWTADSEL